MAGRTPEQLSPKERLFIDEYILDHNATRAYKAAGYTCKNDGVAGVQGHRLLMKPKVADMLRKIEAARSIKTGASLQKTVEELLCIAHLDPADLVDFSTTPWKPKPGTPPEHVRRAISSFEFDPVRRTTKIKFWSKTDALDKLMRHLGGYERDKDKGDSGLLEVITRLQLDLDVRKKLLDALKRECGTTAPAPEAVILATPDLNGEAQPNGTETEPDRPGPGVGQPEQGGGEPPPPGHPAPEARVQDPQPGEGPGGGVGEG